jgi:hypothetical protein
MKIYSIWFKLLVTVNFISSYYLVLMMHRTPISVPIVHMSGDVEVRPSRIPGAGNGLFALRNFKKGEVVCEYVGKVLTFLQMLKATDKTYMMGGFALNIHLDAKDCPESMGRYINDPINSELINAEFRKLKQEQKALVIALREIKVCNLCLGGIEL